MKTLRRAAVSLLLVAAGGVGSMAQVPGEAWTRIGLLSGNVTTVAVSPAYNTDKTLYAGIAGSGLWRSTDRGTTWAHLSSVPNTATVTAIAFDPRYTPGAGWPAYVGTQEGYVYASFDDFASVNPSYLHQFLNGQSQPVPVTGLAVPPTGSWQLWVFAAVQGMGVYYNYSYGGGAMWHLDSPATMSDARGLAVGPAGQVLAAVRYVDGGPVFQYGGAGTWTPLGPTALVGATPMCLASRADGAGNMNIWVGTTNHGLWRYHFVTGPVWDPGCDGTSGTTTTPYPASAVAACPNYGADAEVWEGRWSGLFTSTDGGVTCGLSSPVDIINAIAFSPGYHTGGLCDAFVATTSGLFLRTCGPAPPAQPVTPPAVTVSKLAVAQSALPGAWAASGYGLLRNTTWDPATGRPYFLQYNASGSGLGAIPTLAGLCLAPTYARNGACGTDAATLVAAEKTQGVFRSRDHGNSWTKLDYNSQGVSTWPSGASAVTVNDLAISPKYSTGGADETIFAATSGGLYRWDGAATGWVRVAIDWLYNFTKVALPNSYDRAAGTSWPYQTVYLATDNATASGLYISFNNGQTIARVSDTDVQAPDITAIAFSPGYGVSDYLAFVSRAAAGTFYTNDWAGGAPVFWCPFNSGLPSLKIRDLKAAPAFFGSSYVRLLAATDVGPAYCNFLKTNASYQCLAITYAWASSSITFPSGCTDTLSAAFAYLGDGSVAAVGTAEDGVFFSVNGGQTFPATRAGVGYRSLPDDVWTTFPYMRGDMNDPSAASSILLAASPTFGVFVSHSKGTTFQPYNGPGCTPLNDGAYGFGGGFERLGADPNYAGWTDDALFAGTKCGGLYYRRILARYGTTVYYPYYLDWYAWAPTNPNPAPPQPVGPFQKIVTLTNGNIAESIRASSANDVCPGLGQYWCPAGTATEFSADNAGLPSADTPSVRYGTTTAPAPTPLTLGVNRAGAVAQGVWNYYTIQVPAGLGRLSVVLHQLDQDADVYLRYAGPPTPSYYDYVSAAGGIYPDNVEVSPSSTPVPLVAGTWYIGVRGFAAGTTHYTLTVSDAQRLTSGVGVSGSVAQYANIHYYIVVPAGYPHLNLTLTGLSGDADLFARSGVVASNTSYEYWSTAGGTTNENIDITTATTPPLVSNTVEFVDVYGYAAGPISYTVTGSLLTTLAPGGTAAVEPWPPAKEGGAPAASLSAPVNPDSLPGPLAPAAGTVWGTVSNSGVYRGSVVGGFAASPAATTWAARNGSGPGALDLSRSSQSVIQLTDGTLLAGQAGALWQSPAPDEGASTWNDFSAGLSGTSLDIRDFLECGNGDVLVGVNGTAGQGGVWLSGSQGRYWMNLSSGFDASSQKLETLVKDNPVTGAVQYYTGTDSTGAYTRTITPQPYPVVSGISVATGPAAGGTSVTVTGSNFSNSCPTGTPSDCPSAAPLVLFGDRAVTATFVNSGQLTAVTPYHGAGAVTVRVVNPDSRMGTCACTFTFTGDDPIDLRLSRVYVSGGWRVRLSWGVSTTVNIQRATDAQFTQNVVSVTATGTNWTDMSSAGSDGTQYFYRVL